MLTPRRLLLVAPLAFALVIPACGGGRTDKTYSADSTRTCLSGVADVDPDASNVDAIALDASGGAIRAEVHGNEVILSFGTDAGEARHIEYAYKGAMAAFGGSVERDGNAVLAWTDSPTNGERSSVHGCLTE